MKYARSKCIHAALQINGKRKQKGEKKIVDPPPLLSIRRQLQPSFLSRQGFLTTQLSTITDPSHYIFLQPLDA